MRQLKKLAYAAFGLLALTGCEGGELYDVNAPDWISDKIQEIEDSKKDPQEEEELEGMLEDVYTIGNTDYSSGFLNPYSKEYVIPDGQKWNAVFDLHINPDDNTYYKNVALVIYNSSFIMIQNTYPMKLKDVKSMVSFVLTLLPPLGTQNGESILTAHVYPQTCRSTHKAMDKSMPMYKS